MSTRLDTPFDSFKFTDDEVNAAMIFSDLQKQHLRNELTEAAIAKLGVMDNPENLMQFALEHKYLQGKIDVLTYLLATSASCEAELYSPDQPSFELSQANKGNK